MRRASSSFPRLLLRPLLAGRHPPAPPLPLSPAARRPIPSPQWPPPHSIQTLAPPPSPPLNSAASAHRKTVLTAPTAAETLAAFQSLEPTLLAGDLESPAFAGLCLDVAKRLASFDPPDLENSLGFAVRALKAFQSTRGGRSIEVAGALRFIGWITFSLGNFDDSLRSLETAEEILGFVNQELGVGGEFRSVLVEVEVQLARTKNALGRRREAVANLRMSVELREGMMGPENEVLGAAYVELAEAYVAVLDFAEALPFCRKAMDLYEEEYGRSSMEVVKIRRLLGVIYIGLGENEEALEQLELVRRELAGLEGESVLIQVEIDAANIQIALGRLDEARNTIIRAVQRTG